MGVLFVRNPDECGSTCLRNRFIECLMITCAVFRQEISLSVQFIRQHHAYVFFWKRPVCSPDPFQFAARMLTPSSLLVQYGGMLSLNYNNSALNIIALTLATGCTITMLHCAVPSGCYVYITCVLPCAETTNRMHTHPTL